MKKRLVAFFLAFVLVLSTSVAVLGGSGGIDGGQMRPGRSYIPPVECYDPQPDCCEIETP